MNISKLLVLIVSLAMVGYSTGVLEPCINGFECDKDWMKCTNLEYVGTPEQFDYNLPALMGFVCLPHYEVDSI